MIIRSKNNDHRLRLTKTRLQQIDFNSNRAWYVTAGDIRTAYRTHRSYLIQIRETGLIHCFNPASANLEQFTLKVSFQLPAKYRDGKIGCETFDTKTFNLILRTVGAKAGRRV